MAASRAARRAVGREGWGSVSVAEAAGEQERKDGRDRCGRARSRVDDEREGAEWGDGGAGSTQSSATEGVPE